MFIDGMDVNVSDINRDGEEIEEMVTKKSDGQKFKFFWFSSFSVRAAQSSSTDISIIIC